MKPGIALFVLLCALCGPTLAAEAPAVRVALTLEETKQIEAARIAVLKTPEIEAATAKFNAARKAYQLDRAKFPADRNPAAAVSYRQATKEYDDAQRKAMLAQNPALAPLLEKADATAKPGKRKTNEGETVADSDSLKNPAVRPIQDEPSLPRVLLIGDSISIGYTLQVREKLKGKANVHRIPVNGGATEVGLARMKAWLGDGHWDVIHFNFGLHDAKYASETTQRATRGQYVENLRTLVAQMKATGAKLIFATTTPVPNGGVLSPTRKFDNIPARNEIAVRLMQDNGVAIDDLYAAVLPVQEMVGRPNDVHYQPEGYEVLAKSVTASIEAELAGPSESGGRLKEAHFDSALRTPNSPLEGGLATSAATGGMDWARQAAADAKQDRTTIIFDGASPNKMVCDTTLRELPDGSWIHFMLAGGDTEPSPLNYTGVTRSRDQGRTWTKLERFDVGFPREGKTIGQGPTELMIHEGRCTLFFGTHAKHWNTEWRSWFLTSDDSFKTWSKPREVPGRLKERTFIRNHIVTRDGRILLPFQHYIGPEAEQSKLPLERKFTNPRNGVLMSSDGGKTWTERGNIRLTTNDLYSGWAENNLAELRDGRIAMIIRADRLGGVLYYAESPDGGRTWPEFARKTDIPNPGSKATLYNIGPRFVQQEQTERTEKANSGSSLLPPLPPVKNQPRDAIAILHNPNPKIRSPLSLWISFDGLKTWPYQRILQKESCDGPKGRMNYPDGFVSKDRQWLHFAYDDNRHRAVYYGAKLPPIEASE